MKLKHLLLIVSAPIVLNGCVSSQKVQVVQAGDDILSCEQIKTALDEVEAINAANDKNKGLTGANVAAALFFWPALAVNHKNIAEAEQLAIERIEHLTKLYISKNC